MKNTLAILPKFICLFVFVSCHTNEKPLDIPIAPTESIKMVVGIARIEPQDAIIQLASPVNGIVKKIWKRENDTVTAGEVVLELDHELEDAKVIQLKKEVKTQAGQIKEDEAAVGEYEAKYKNAVEEAQRLKALVAKGAETQQELDNANTNVKSMLSNLNRLQSQVYVSKSKLDQTLASLDVSVAERNQKFIRSPVKGNILEINCHLGESVDTRQSFAQISPQGKIIAVSEIDERNAEQVKIGQKAWLRNVGLSDTLATGVVYFASSFLKKKSLFTDQTGEKEDRRVRTIKVLLDNPEHLLLNARVECVVDIASQSKH